MPEARLKKHVSKIDTPPLSSDTDLALLRTGIELTKEWMDNAPSDVTSLDILEQIGYIVATAVDSPMERGRLLTFIDILKEEETINNG